MEKYLIYYILSYRNVPSFKCTLSRHGVHAHIYDLCCILALTRRKSCVKLHSPSSSSLFLSMGSCVFGLYLLGTDPYASITLASAPSSLNSSSVVSPSWLAASDGHVLHESHSTWGFNLLLSPQSTFISHSSLVSSVHLTKYASIYMACLIS